MWYRGTYPDFLSSASAETVIIQMIGLNLYIVVEFDGSWVVRYLDSLAGVDGWRAGGG